jgi:hypothetical protein
VFWDLVSSTELLPSMGPKAVLVNLFKGSVRAPHPLVRQKNWSQILHSALFGREPDPARAASQGVLTAGTTAAGCDAWNAIRRYLPVLPPLFTFPPHLPAKAKARPPRGHAFCFPRKFYPYLPFSNSRAVLHSSRA